MISAVILAPLALACIWLGGWFYVAMIAFIAAGLAAEWAGMCGVSWWQPGALVGMAAVAAASVAGPAIGIVILTVGTLASGLIPAPTSCPGLSGPPPSPDAGGDRVRPGRNEGGGVLALGIPYIGIAVIALVWLRAAPDVGRANLLGLMLLVWGSDIGAYLVGRLIGGPKLAPSISPGKTWSGAVGGLLAAVGIALATAWSLGTMTHPERTIATAILLGIAAQTGDLLESRIKRHFHVKDSGTIIPGHGGLLDRLDALLIAAPIAAILAWMAGSGVSLWQ